MKRVKLLVAEEYIKLFGMLSEYLDAGGDPDCVIISRKYFEQFEPKRETSK